MCSVYSGTSIIIVDTLGAATCFLVREASTLFCKQCCFGALKLVLNGEVSCMESEYGDFTKRGCTVHVSV